jgi:hypothetical protein
MQECVWTLFIQFIYTALLLCTDLKTLFSANGFYSLVKATIFSFSVFFFSYLCVLR